MNGSTPEHVHCCKTGHVKDTLTICGKPFVGEWVFQDPTHALLNAKQGGRLQLCPRCADGIQQMLNAARGPG